jgi:molecular chaperone Hsp33
MVQAVTSELTKDFIQPFLIDQSNIKGRFIRLNDVANEIISQHDYPDIVSSLLAELLVLAAMLSANLKSQGVLTIQVKGDALINFIVVDGVFGGGLRGYADISEENLKELKSLSERNTPPRLERLFGKGYVVITYDTGKDKKPYQGIVELTGRSFSEAMESYFVQSQQLEVAIKTTVEAPTGKKHHNEWSAGGMIIERMPNAESDEAEQLELWERSRIFTYSVKQEELLDLKLPPMGLLYRLYNEDGVWAYSPIELSKNCRCSREKILNVLKTLPKGELAELLEDNEVSINCQFCNKAEMFNAKELEINTS